jgi:hypothetical protein
MSGKTESAARALNRVPSLHSDFHAGILAELSKEGLLDDAPGGEIGELHAAHTSDKLIKFSDLRRAAVLTWVQAASNPQNLPLLKSVLASAKRLGCAELFEDDGKPINVAALNRALRDKSVEDRFKFKSELYTLRLIPA